MPIYTYGDLDTSELVALLLGLGAPNPAVTRMTAAMNDAPVSGMALAEVAREVGSVGQRRVARLEASVELGRRMLRKSVDAKRVISTPEEVAELIRPMAMGLHREHFWSVMLNTKNHLLKVAEISVGSLNASIVHPRELFKEAVKVSAASVVVVHNHPSSDVTPSGADISLTRRLVKAGDVLGIEVLDHMVIGGDEHASLRDLGLM
jgi:DNA repair protein RadC